MKYVVDTCIINRLVDERLPLDFLTNKDCVASHVQIDELRQTRDARHRRKLLEAFSATVTEEIPTESFAIGVSAIGAAKIGDGSQYDAMKSALDALNNGKTNNTHDVLIAEVALKNGFTLITADRHLSDVAAEHGCAVIFVEEAHHEREERLSGN